MTFFEAALIDDHKTMYDIQKDMTLLERLFSFKLFKVHFNQCCGGKYSTYCKTQDSLFFKPLPELKQSMGLGECGQWDEELALTFPEYQQLLKELDDVKDRIKA